jgi:molybdate-binding protein
LNEIRRHLGERATVLVALGRWEVGIVAAQGNPKGIMRIDQLARKGVRLAAREVGSGARQVLDRALAGAGLSVKIAKSAHLQVTSHRRVGLAISMNAADVGIATRDVAIAFGLDFIPIAEERFDLALPNTALSDPRISRMFETLTSASFRRELEAVGYDTACSGDRIADIAA